MKNSDQQAEQAKRYQFYRQKTTKSPTNKNNSNYIKNEFHPGVIISKLQINFPKMKICQSKKDLNESNYYKQMQNLQQEHKFNKQTGQQSNWHKKTDKKQNQYLFQNVQKQHKLSHKKQKSPIKFNQYSYQETTKQQYQQNMQSYHDFHKSLNQNNNSFNSKQILNANFYKTNINTKTSQKRQASFDNSRQISKKGSSFSNLNKQQMSLSQLLNDLQHRSEKLYQIFGQNNQGYQKCIQSIENVQKQKQKSILNYNHNSTGYCSTKYQEQRDNQGYDLQKPNMLRKNRSEDTLFSRKILYGQQPHYQLFQTSQKQVQMPLSIKSISNQLHYQTPKKQIKNTIKQKFLQNQSKDNIPSSKTQRKKKVLFYTPIDEQQSQISSSKHSKHQSPYSNNNNIQLLYHENNLKVLNKIIPFLKHLNKFFNLYLFNILRSRFYYETGILSTQSIIHSPIRHKQNIDEEKIKEGENKDVSFFEEYYKDRNIKEKEKYAAAQNNNPIKAKQQSSKAIYAKNNQQNFKYTQSKSIEPPIPTRNYQKQGQYYGNYKKQQHKPSTPSSTNKEQLSHKNSNFSSTSHDENLYINSNINRHVQELLIQSKNTQMQGFGFKGGNRNKNQDFINQYDAINQKNQQNNYNKMQSPIISKNYLINASKGFNKLQQVMKYKILTILRLGFLVMKFIGPAQNDNQGISSLKISSASMKKIFQQKQSRKDNSKPLGQNYSKGEYKHMQNSKDIKQNSRIIRQNKNDHQPVNILDKYYKKVSSPNSAHTQYKSILDQQQHSKPLPSNVSSKKSYRNQRIQLKSHNEISNNMNTQELEQIKHIKQLKSSKFNPALTNPNALQTSNNNLVQNQYYSNNNTVKNRQIMKNQQKIVRQSRALSNRSSQTHSQSKGSLSNLINNNNMHQALFNQIQNNHNHNFMQINNNYQPDQITFNKNSEAQSSRTSRVLSGTHFHNNSHNFNNASHQQQNQFNPSSIKNSTVRTSRIEVPSTISHRNHHATNNIHQKSPFSQSSAAFYRKNDLKSNNNNLAIPFINNGLLDQRNKKISRSYSENDFMLYHQNKFSNFQTERLNQNRKIIPNNNAFESIYNQGKKSGINYLQQQSSQYRSNYSRMKPEQQDYYATINDLKRQGQVINNHNTKSSKLFQNAQHGRSRINTMGPLPGYSHSQDARPNSFNYNQNSYNPSCLTPSTSKLIPNVPANMINSTKKYYHNVNFSNNIPNTIRPSRQIRTSSINNINDKKRSYSHGAVMMNPINSNSIYQNIARPDTFSASNGLGYPSMQLNDQIQAPIMQSRIMNNKFPLQNNLPLHNYNCLVNVPMQQHLSKQPFIQYNHDMGRPNNFQQTSYFNNQPINYTYQQPGRSRVSKSVDSGLISQIGRRMQIPLQNNINQYPYNQNFNSIHAQINPQSIPYQPNQHQPQYLSVQNQQQQNIYKSSKVAYYNTPQRLQQVENQYHMLKKNQLTAINLQGQGFISNPNITSPKATNIKNNQNQMAHKYMKTSDFGLGKQQSNGFNGNKSKNNSNIKNSRSIYEQQNLLLLTANEPEAYNLPKNKISPKYNQKHDYVKHNQISSTKNHQGNMHLKNQNYTNELRKPPLIKQQQGLRVSQQGITNMISKYPSTGVQSNKVAGPVLGKSPSSIIKQTKSPQGNQHIKNNKLGGLAPSSLKKQIPSTLNLNKNKKLSQYGQQ